MQNHVDILGIINAFARTWRSWLAGSVAVGVAAILYVAYIVPVEFRSSAIVLPPTGGAPSLIAKVETCGPRVSRL